MKIYALLIGINEYVRNPLSQCVSDSKKIESYLKGLAEEPYNHEIEFKILHNQDATKANIVKGISEFLSQAKDEDVAFFYFSGHGGLEDAKGRFHDEHDGLIECLACYFEKKDQWSGFFLSDKEIRYLFNEKIRSNPHLVTVFDCCHSGDMVRAGDNDSGGDKIKRMSGFYPARDYNEFVFHDIPEEKLRSKPLAEIFPYKNHIHIAACSSSQYSWEDKYGGVFTRYLLYILKEKRNRITYQGITRWAKIGLRDLTKKKQSPMYSVQGEGKMSSSSSWFNLHKIELESLPALINHNAAKGWYLNMGKLMGVKKGNLVYIDEVKDKEGKPIILEVIDADMEFSLLEDPAAKGYKLSDDNYKVSINSTFSQLNLHINDLDQNPLKKKRIEEVLKPDTSFELSTLSGADFNINIFNEMVYFSLPSDQYRPLARQINLKTQLNNLDNIINHQINHLVKWNHFDSLDNLENDFENPPIKVELKIRGEDSWHDVTNNNYLMDPIPEKQSRKSESGTYLENFWMQAYQIKVTNVSDHTIYVGVLQLASNMGISSDMWDQQVIELNSKEEKYFYDHKGSFCAMAIDPHMEIYNWRHEWAHYKFIVSDYENFETSIHDYLQPGLEEPMIIDPQTKKLKGLSRAVFPLSDIEEVDNRWGTLKTTIELRNPDFNTISSDLEDLWEYYLENEQLAPFIKRLYADHQLK